MFTILSRNAFYPVIAYPIKHLKKKGFIYETNNTNF